MSAAEHLASDITERLEEVAGLLLEIHCSALNAGRAEDASLLLEHSALLLEAQAEIERLRNELKKEIFNTNIRNMRSRK